LAADLNIPALVRMREQVALPSGWFADGCDPGFHPGYKRDDPNRDMGHWGKRSPPPLVSEPDRTGSKGKTGHEVALDGTGEVTDMAAGVSWMHNYPRKVWGY